VLLALFLGCVDSSEPAALTVTPDNGLSLAWTQGNELPTESITYTIRNTSNEAVSWQVATDVNWVELSATTGTLAPNATAEFEVGLAAAASSLPVGDHSGGLKITLGQNLEVSRPVSLAVKASTSPYEQWSNGPSTSPSYFPIGVWLQDPALAPTYKSIGINLYVGLYKGPTSAQLDVLSSNDMQVVATQNSTALAHPRLALVRGWQQTDEPDNARWNGQSFDPPIPPSEIISLYQQILAKDRSRPVFLNFGRGVAYESWPGRGTRTGHLEDYPEYIKGADIVSFDIYPVTSPETAVKGKLEFVAKGVERLVQWSKGEKIVWNCIETTHVNSNVRPTPDEIKTEVWMSLIHGSMGIIYFVHEWQPAFRADAIRLYPEIMQAVKDINAEVTSLAPVLNSPTLANVTTVATTNSIPLAQMTKGRDGATYVFAVAMRKSFTTATFTVEGLPASATAEVVGESRVIPVINGKFEDAFQPYAVHLYKIR